MMERSRTSIGATTSARTLAGIVEHAHRDDVLRRDDLRWGDRVIVATRNSVYTIWALDGDAYVVSGGWFDHRGLSPALTTIHGCTYGGSALRHDVIAGRDLFLEFGNHVLTTRIRSVRVLRFPESSDLH
jgi:hypothetical protein